MHYLVPCSLKYSTVDHLTVVCYLLVIGLDLLPHLDLAAALRDSVDKLSCSNWALVWVGTAHSARFHHQPVPHGTPRTDVYQHSPHVLVDRSCMLDGLHRAVC